jgi:toxin YoeB
MTGAFTPNGWADYSYRQQQDQQILNKINELIRDISRDPFNGLGKPEPLRGNLKGYMSRRISGEHRLVYRVSGTKPDQTVTIIKARFHYE